MPQRPRLSEKIRQEIMYASAFACAVCSAKVDHIHHIDKNNANNIPDNLINLCQTHHNEAHTKRELSANLSPVRLKGFRKRWYSEVALKRLKQTTASGHSDEGESFSLNATWSYINHARLIQTASKDLVSQVNPTLMFRLKSLGLIDESGLLIKPDNYTPASSYLRNKVYDYYEHTDSIALHMFYSELVDLFVSKIEVIQLDEYSWNRKFIKQMITPGTFIFVSKAQYFKKTYEDTTNAEVGVHTFKRRIEIQYMINTRNMFGMTAVTCSFTGHRSCASLLQVKSIEDVGAKRIIHCTPTALGIGFESNFELAH